MLDEGTMAVRGTKRPRADRVKAFFFPVCDVLEIRL